MDKYKDLGFKLTPQRLAILDYLEGNRRHPSAEDIYRQVSKKFPHMSLATVYNTLEVLKAQGKILELKLDPERKRFDPDLHPHHHLICVRCKKIVDIPGEIPAAAKNSLPHPYRKEFEILGSYTEFYGLCKSCQKRR